MDDFALEFQVAIVEENLSDYDRAVKIKTLGRDINSLWKGIRPTIIPTIPKNVTFEIFMEDGNVQNCLKDPASHLNLIPNSSAIPTDPAGV